MTSLATLLVQQAGKSVAVAGNIGPTLLDTLGQRLDAADLLRSGCWAVELSTGWRAGFRAHGRRQCSSARTTLDWHGSLQAYTAAKARIFNSSRVMGARREDAVMWPCCRRRCASAAKPQPRAHVTFGADMPQRPGDFGIEVVSGMAWLVRA